MKAARFFIWLPVLFSLACSEAFQSGSGETGPTPSVTLPEMSVTEEGYLTLSKEALGREFLLQASFIDAGAMGLPSPNFQGTQSRIITFKQKNSSLFMMESNEGLLSSQEIPVEWILTEFKIVEEDEATMTIDFNEGMKNIFYGWDWYASDFQYGREPTIAIRAPHAFLKEVTHDQRRVVIRQAAQLEISFIVNFLLPVEIVYYLEPYAPDPSFQGIPSPGFDRVGFFETNPLVRPDFGDYQTTITRWNLNRPVVFHISDNTPPEYVEAVQEGVLYWNKAFGAEVVQAQMGPPGVRAPHPDYNIIQWVTNHYAGFAYADAQMDPRTGEILHAQIYLTSTFATPVLSSLDQLDRTDENDEGPSSEDPRTVLLGLKGLRPGLLCIYPAHETPANLLAEGRISESTALKMTQDYVRDVTAHEVGHTLGLRHNFAASTGSRLTPPAATELFETYLDTGSVEVPNQVASSVMDYLTFEDSILNGRYLTQPNAPALTYDAMALHWAHYGVEPLSPLEETLYCSDRLVFRYADCAVWDGASHPLLSHAYPLERGIEKLPSRIAWLFLNAKTNLDPEERKPVGLVPLQAERFAYFLTGTLRQAFELLKENSSRSLLVERTIGPVTDVNSDAVEAATMDWINEAVAVGGGIRNIFRPIDQKTVYSALKNGYARFVSIIENPDYRSGQTPFGESYAFTDQEIEVMKQRVRPFFDLVAQKSSEAVTEILAGGETVVLDETSIRTFPPDENPIRRFRNLRDIGALETTLGNWAEYIITDGAEAVPTFEGRHRLAAVQILLPFIGPTENWQRENRERTLTLLLDKLEERYGVPFPLFDPCCLSEEEMELYRTEQMIVAALSMNPSPGAEPPVPAAN